MAHSVLKAPFLLLFLAAKISAFESPYASDNGGTPQAVLDQERVHGDPVDAFGAPLAVAGGPQGAPIGGPSPLENVQLEGAGEESFLFERQGALVEPEGVKEMPKLRGRKSLIFGLSAAMLILIITAVLEAQKGYPNNMVSVVKSPDVSTSLKARSLRHHFIKPGGLLPYSSSIYIAYAAAWAFAVSGLLSLIQSKNKQKKFINNQKVAPSRDMRPLHLAITGAAITAISALFVLLNIPNPFFLLVQTGVGVSMAGLAMLLAKMMETGNPHKAVFPDPE